MERDIHWSEGLALSVATYGKGWPMVFQHGLCGDARQPADVFPNGIGWSAVTLECRGHGSSEAGSPEDFSIASFANDLISLIEARDFIPMPLAGISMGAAIALRVAVRRPDLVSALLLARPAWLDRAAPVNMQPNVFIAGLLRDHPPVEAKEIFDRSQLAVALAEDAPDNLASLRGFFAREPVETTRELLSRISKDGPGVDQEDIAALRVPVLVIGNARDAVHPLGMARKLAALIPGARFAQVTSKSDNRDLYRSEFRAAVASFLQDFLP